MKLLTQKFVRSLDASKRKVMLKQSIEMSKCHSKCFELIFKLMQKQTGIYGNTYICSDPKWLKHPMHSELHGNLDLQYRHDANTRLLRDL